METTVWRDVILTKDKEGHFRIYDTLDEARKDRDLLPSPIPYRPVQIGFQDGDWFLKIGNDTLKLTDMVSTVTE